MTLVKDLTRVRLSLWARPGFWAMAFLWGSTPVEFGSDDMLGLDLGPGFTFGFRLEKGSALMES